MHGGATGWLSCQGNLPATAARDVRMFTITWEVNAMDILIGILILVLGASVATMGLRLWFWMLPILGFMTGFFLGAIFILGLVGDGILETALSCIVIASTAIAGGIGVVSGLLLVFDQIHISDLGEGNAVAVINNSLGWWLLWLAVAAVGIVVQLRYTAVVALPEERYVRTTRAIRP